MTAIYESKYDVLYSLKRNTKNQGHRKPRPDHSSFCSRQLLEQTLELPLKSLITINSKWQYYVPFNLVF